MTDTTTPASMQHADTLTVIHHDDTTTRYSDVRYTLTRREVRILAAGGEHRIDRHDVLNTHATRRRPR